MTLLGIDIGGTAVKAASIGPGGDRLVAVSDAYARPDRKTLRHAITVAIGRLGPQGFDTGRVRAVGLCVPGRRNADRTAIELAVNVPGLEGYRFDEIVRDLAGRDGLPQRVMTDAEAATADAARDFPGVRRILGIAIGTGVGCCLLEDGVAQRIGSGGIGHLGQIDLGPIDLGPVDRGPVDRGLVEQCDRSGTGAGLWCPLGPDGGRGSAEAFLGVPAWRARYGERFIDRLSDVMPDDPALVAAARLIRVGLAIYTPQLVLVLGGVGLALGRRSAEIDRLVRTELTRVAPAGWRLAFGTSLHHAAFGAALGAGQIETGGA